MLELPSGEMVAESAVIAAFASDSAVKGQGIPLWPQEAAEPGDAAAAMRTAKAKIQMLRFDKFLAKFWPCWGGRWENADYNAALKE